MIQASSLIDHPFQIEFPVFWFRHDRIIADESGRSVDKSSRRSLEGWYWAAIDVAGDEIFQFWRGTVLRLAIVDHFIFEARKDTGEWENVSIHSA